MTAAAPSLGGGKILPTSLAKAAGVAAGDELNAITAPARGQFLQFWDSFRSHRMAFIGLCVLSTMIVTVIFLPFVIQSPTDIDMKLLAATPPSSHHIMGTDSIGRDVFSRLVNAGRKSLIIGFFVAIIAASVGSTVGVAAGYFGGWVDGVLMWWVNVLMTIPSIPLLIAVAVLVASPDSKIGPIIGGLPEEWRIILVMSSLGWMGISRVVRSQVLSLRKQEFVEAALALGARHPRIMFLHILPNSVSVIAVFTTLAVSGAIIGESALSFLGMGVQPPTATWGNMLAEARDLFTIMEYWWLTWFPAMAIFITVLSVNFIGDGVRDALDPKSLKK
jgi:peptide/nickel transport system permease protein